MILRQIFIIGTIAFSTIVGIGCQGDRNLQSPQNPSVSSTPKPEPVVPENKPPSEVPQGASRPLSLEDKAESDRDFFEFRERLRQAVRDRDANFIRSIVPQTARLSFGNPTTLDDLDINNPKAPIWTGMEKAFFTGCAEASHPVQTLTWVCPNVFAVWPEGLDAFSYVAIVGEDVNVRSQPTTESPAIGTVSNEILELDREALQKMPPLEFNNPNGWTPAIAPDGQRGYVLNRYVYSTVGHRGFFEKIDGEWKMTLFVAGD